MSRGRGQALVGVAVLLGWTVVAAAETPQERRRRELMDEVGLRRQPAAEKPVGSTAAPAAGAPSAPATATPEEGPAAATKPGARPPAPSFRRTIHPALVQACRVCHVPGGPAGATRLILSGEPAADHRVVLLFIDAREPAASPLLSKAGGQAHGGGALWPRGGVVAARVTTWISLGARLDGALGVPVETAPLPPGVPRLPRVAAAPEATAAPVVGPAAPVRSAPPPSPAPSAEPPAAPPVHTLLMGTCASCHRAGMPAAASRFVLSGASDADLALAASLVDGAEVARSPLLVKARGELHGGGAVLPVGGDGYQRLLVWATALGAATTADRPPAAAGAVATPSPAERSVESRSPPPSPTPAAPAPGRPGLGLPYGFQLNGRFDLNYERRAFTSDPTMSGAANALRSYHHFLFLSRQAPEERIGLSVELLGLLFWEANLRFHPRESWQVVVAAGKIVVPFGADPLTHQSYGGLAGFDQRILPSLWATEGAAVHLTARKGDLVFTDDLYVIRGLALRGADAVLSLRADLSPDDDARLAVGTRMGVAWGPLAVWYSAMFNPLGYDRRLFMQAADVTLWRAREQPVLRYLSIGAGLMRADVSGAGPGGDYYHFGSYFQVRVHPRDWIYLQYRQGVATFDNRRGAFVDRTRLTSDDSSAHNVGVVARRGGLSVGLFWFVNLEAVEVPNDLVRAVVTYEF